MSVTDERNSDLAGTFHITSTWKKSENTYKLIFNMDSRIMWGAKWIKYVKVAGCP